MKHSASLANLKQLKKHSSPLGVYGLASQPGIIWG